MAGEPIGVDVGRPSAASTQIVWLSLTGLILWYLFRPYVRAYFGM